MGAFYAVAFLPFTGPDHTHVFSSKGAPIVFLLADHVVQQA